MQVAIRTSALRLSNTFRELVQERLASAVEPLGRRAQQVYVYLSDVNGNKGGAADKLFRVVVHMRRQPPLVLEHRGASLMPLLQSAVDRLEHACSRRLDRLGSRGRRVSMSGE